jgi:hypothetical protein
MLNYRDIIPSPEAIDVILAWSTSAVWLASTRTPWKVEKEVREETVVASEMNIK